VTLRVRNCIVYIPVERMELGVGVHNLCSYRRSDSSSSCVKWRLYRHNGLRVRAYSSINKLFLDAACLYVWHVTEIGIVSSRPEFIVFCLSVRYLGISKISCCYGGLLILSEFSLISSPS